MGRSVMATHVLYYTDQGGEHWAVWGRGNGKPSPENIEAWVNSFVVSQYVGNINDGIAKAAGMIMVPHEGRIYRQLGHGQKEMVATWKAPAFWALPPHRLITVAQPDVRRPSRSRNRSSRPRLSR